ncbi:MAG: FG-GAP-like repeat-containing protein, partial [Planctomycetota bacterium]
NNNSSAVQLSVSVDTVAPSAYFSPVTTPTFTSINIIQINFSEPILGFNISDLTIACNGTNVNLNGISLSTLNPYAFTINNLAAVNSNDGTYVLTLNTSGAGIVDNAGNSLVTNSNLTWTYTAPVNPSTPTGDVTPPSVTMGAVPSIGRSGLPQLTITFSESVTGLDIADILLTRNGTAVDIQGAVLTGSGNSYVLQNLENLTYPIGEYHLQIKSIGNGITDIAGNSLINPSAAEWYMAGADNALISLRSPKMDGSLEVRDANTNKSWGIFTPFPGYFGAVHMVKGNFLGDGKEWIVMAAGEGGAPHIVVMDPVTGNVIRSWFGYSTDYRGGVFIAVGDVNGDGADDLITGPSAGGGPHIKVYDGKTNNVIFEFMAYDPSFLGGVSVALADVNEDGRLDIVTGAGKGGGPHVSAFDALNGRELLTFMAYDSTFRGGIFVAAGDSDGNGIWEIITGSGYGGSPNVKTFDIRTLQSIRNFMAYDPAFLGGVRVGLSDRNGDGILDLFTGPGLEGGPHIKVFDGVNLNLIDSFFAGVANDPYGVYVN